MAKKKYYATFESQREFEDHINILVEVGKEVGFEDGLAVGLSFFYEMIDKIESEQKTCDIAIKAQYIYSERRKHEWDKNMKNLKYHEEKGQKRAVEEYLNSIRI